MAQKKRKRRKKNKIIYRIRVFTVLFIMAALLVGIIYAGIRIFTPAQDPSIHISIAGDDFTNKNLDQAIKALTEKYPWSLSVRYEDQEVSVEDFIREEIESVAKVAYDEKDRIIKERNSRGFVEKIKYRFQKEEPVYLTYDLPPLQVDSQLTQLAHDLADQWSKPAEDSVISGFDSSSGKFTYSQPVYGYGVDADILAASLKDAVSRGDYQAQITASAESFAPEVMPDSYRVIGSYKTTATDNASRNTNIRVASQTIDGMIIAPGEQFSFNGVLGRRTPEKGYKEAGAYANGESVQEYGGGVCQVSSTIYNAIIAAGLRTDVRTGHSYEPTYVTPGQDATVSYDYPDFVFTNTSGHPIGLRTIFEVPIVRVEIYGVPILEEGVTQYMKSEKTSEIDPPAPEYVEDPTVPFGQEVIQKNAVNGSVWKTDIVTEKNGEVIDTTYFHSTQYKGKRAVIRRNTTNPAVVAPPQPTPPPAPVTETPQEETTAKKPAQEENKKPAQEETKKPAQEENKKPASNDGAVEVPAD
ncbi:MAG: VanW family protein [Lachnospiraceae bacterium]|nr:VanW family protein [Lachnospiraceae bacterium]